jgi:hypothetical protein
MCVCGFYEKYTMIDLINELSTQRIGAHDLSDDILCLLLCHHIPAPVNASRKSIGVVRLFPINRSLPINISLWIVTLFMLIFSVLPVRNGIERTRRHASVPHIRQDFAEKGLV